MTLGNVRLMNAYRLSVFGMCTGLRQLVTRGAMPLKPRVRRRASGQISNRIMIDSVEVRPRETQQFQPIKQPRNGGFAFGTFDILMESGAKSEVTAFRTFAAPQSTLSAQSVLFERCCAPVKGKDDRIWPAAKHAYHSHEFTNLGGEFRSDRLFMLRRFAKPYMKRRLGSGPHVSLKLSQKPAFVTGDNHRAAVYDQKLPKPGTCKWRQPSWNRLRSFSYKLVS